MSVKSIRLGVNVDHIATLRQARGTDYPDPVEAALIAESAGADGITIHLREDRRHIQDHDVTRMRDAIGIHLNLEMAVTDEMLNIAESVKPDFCCLVPEKREELTTEGGLDVVGQMDSVKAACERLAAAGIQVSLFIDPDQNQIDAAKSCGAPIVELHTGSYAEATDLTVVATELERLYQGAQHAHDQGLVVNAGHGLHYSNTQPVLSMEALNELNIGHSIVARAAFVGMAQAVSEMKAILQS